MGVREHGKTIFHYAGVSSDIKPTSGMPEGSTFHVVDTGEEYVFHNKMWVLDLRRSHALSFGNN